MVAVALGEKDAKNAPANVLQAFSEGAVFGPVMVSQILCCIVRGCDKMQTMRERRGEQEGTLERETKGF